ncbi:hypothetical protein Gotri_012827 [Gossypium trilobum]|uniref:Uncharacterized protein n=1 Tax=Gossypium trilobum TaxID=34281 RepID=A0A7J9DRR1_9ROSI|nr:hypothetical protein [Gossypium trilobum]
MESSLSHRDDYEIAAAAAVKLPSCTYRNDETIINKIENGRERFSFVSFLVAFVSLSQELGTQRGWRSGDVDWQCLLRIIALHLWKNRNLFIFQGISWSDSENIKVSYSWAKQYVSTEAGKTNNSQGKFSHPFLTNDYVLLNTDGSVLEEAGFATTRGIVRD